MFFLFLFVKGMIKYINMTILTALKIIKTVISERSDGRISLHIPKWAISQGKNLTAVRKTERPTPIRFPKPSTTLIPIFLFPNVPCHLEHSLKIKYNETGNVIIIKPVSSAVNGVLENKD